MAKIEVIKEAIGICEKAGITLMIWGKHGLGKSAIVQQVAVENKMGIVNMRLSQMEASDIRGMPDKDDEGRTVYRPPAELPRGDMTWDEAQSLVQKEKDPAKQATLAEQVQSRIESGILFLDESFRAQDDVQQAIFELVYDKKVGQYVLPPKWSIVCANNPLEGYHTNGFTDPAFLDRFCHITLSDGDQTAEAWVDYMVDAHEDDSAEIIEFCASSKATLDGSEGFELGFPITPSRRSWDMVAKVLKACKGQDYSDSAKTEVIAGIVGRDLAISFINYRCPVKPRDIMEHGVQKYEAVLKTLQRNQYLGLTWGLRSFLAQHVADGDVKKIKITLDYAEFMLTQTREKDLITGFLAGLVTGDANDRIKSTRRAALANPKVAALINKAEKKIGKKNTLLQELQKRKSLSQLVSNTAWGTAPTK